MKIKKLITHAMSGLKKFFTDKTALFFYAPVEFKKGDSVQLLSGGVLMIILNVKRNRNKSPATILCQWYDRKKKITRESTFLAPEIKLFDWYHPT